MSTSKSNEMKECDEFKLIQKKIPFEVPNGFFESIAEKTLKEAITRVRIKKRNNLRMLIFSVAASVVLLLYIGLHFIPNSPASQVQNLIADRTQLTNKPTNQFNRGTSNHKNVNESNKVIPGRTNEKKLKTQEETELLRDVLSDLTDDDLQQMAIRYKTDAFINESLQ